MPSLSWTHKVCSTSIPELSQTAAINADWMTDSLLEKIEKHPLLSRALRDPALAQALSQFQTDPESVLRSAAGNPQLQEILREFCSVMGSHFTELADRQDTEKHDESIHTHTHLLHCCNNIAKLVLSVSADFVSIEPDKEVDEVLGREGVKEALSDPQIQCLFSLLRGEDSAKAQRCLSLSLSLPPSLPPSPSPSLPLSPPLFLPPSLSLPPPSLPPPLSPTPISLSFYT